MKLLRAMDLGCKLGVIKVNILIYNKALDLMLDFPRVLDTEFNQTLEKKEKKKKHALAPEQIILLKVP